MPADPRSVRARYDAGQPVLAFDTEEREILRQMILKSAAYHDPKHGDHDILIRDARRLYEILNPEPLE
jgi:hypothetical protein